MTAALDPKFLAGFALFAFATSVTPGPNNLMMMASGANFGLRRTLPHMAGVVIGFTFLILAVGLGLGAIFGAWPGLQVSMYWAGSAYLLWFAWKIATAGAAASASAPQPRRFFEIVAFQWVNPKAWTGAIGAVATYAPAHDYFAYLVVICATFAAVNVPVTVLWTVGGAVLTRTLQNRVALRAFNIAMALLLVLSLPPVAQQGGRLAAALARH